MSVFDKIYSQSPVALQNLFFSAYGIYWKWLRFGGSFPQYVRDYQNREFWNMEEWSEYQQKRLRNLLTAASQHVPYYRDQWTAAQKKSASVGDLNALPLLEKSEIRGNERSFLRDDMHPRHIKFFATSGSTGTPIKTIWTPVEIRDSLAVREVRSANWAGVSFCQPRATFSGRMIEPDPNSKGPFYRFNVAEQQVYFSAFHLRPDTARYYVDALHRHKVVWMTGYAVSFFLLAQLVLKQDLLVEGIRAVITTSEKLTPEMRSAMERAFHCPIFEEYSTVENALFASECERGRLHVSPDVSVVEILRPDGTACTAGEPGEVVTTCLMRDYQPMIRFRLGDVAAWSEEVCPCGRSMPVIQEVVGRIEDVVVGPDGRQMVRFHGVFTNQPHVLEGQIVQETLNFIRVLIVPINGFDDADRDTIVARLRQRLGDDMEFNVELVDTIPRTKAGKFQAVVSKLKGHVP